MKKTTITSVLAVFSLALGTSFGSGIKTNIVTLAIPTSFISSAIPQLEAKYNFNNQPGGVSPLGGNWSLIARSGDGSSQTKDTYRLYGYTNGTSANFITVASIGSEAVVKSLANKTVKASFLPVTTASTTSAGISAATYQDQVKIGLTDLKQINSHFYNKGIGSLGDTLKYDALPSPVVIALEGYSWYRGGTNWPVGATNITREIEYELFNNGQVPLARFTGDTNDLNRPVFLVGRNTDSGARAAALLNAGVPITQDVLQYAVDPTNGTISTYPAETVSGLTLTAGRSGYPSSSKLITALQKASLGTNLVVGYAVNGSQTTGVSVLTHEGVSPSASNIVTGNYPFWANIYAYTPKGGLTGFAAGVFDEITRLFTTGTGFKTESTGSAVRIDDLIISRSVDFGPISSR